MTYAGKTHKEFSLFASITLKLDSYWDKSKPCIYPLIFNEIDRVCQEFSILL